MSGVASARLGNHDRRRAQRRNFRLFATVSIVALVTSLTLALGGVWLGSSRSNLAGWLMVPVLLSLVWIAVLFVVIEESREQTFKVDRTGFAPPRLPWNRVFRSNLVRFHEVDRLILAVDRTRLSALVVLDDGLLLHLERSDQISESDLKELARCYQDASGLPVATLDFATAWKSIFPGTKSFEIPLPTPPATFDLPIEMDASDFRRRQSRVWMVALGLGALMVALVLLAVFLAVNETPGTDESAHIGGLIASCIAVGLLIYALVVLRRSSFRFVMSDKGFAPRYVFDGLTRARRVWVQFGEIESCMIQKWAGFSVADVLLGDGTLVSLDTRSGVPLSALEYLAARVPTRFFDKEAEKRFLDEPKSRPSTESGGRRAVRQEFPSVVPVLAVAELGGVLLFLMASQAYGSCWGVGLMYSLMAAILMLTGPVFLIGRRRLIIAWALIALPLLLVGFAAGFFGC